jgi:plastocyanin
MAWAALALALVGVACGKSSTQSGAPTTPASSVTTPPTTASSPTSGGGTASLTVAQVDFRFMPETFTVKSGSTIAVHDATPRTPHTFTIEGKGINVVNNPGQTQTVAINLPPGTYPFICTFHQASGMKGTLTVT